MVPNRLARCRILSELVSPAIEIVIGVPVSLGIAIFGLELPSPKISTPLSFVIELCCQWALLVFRVWSVGLIEMSLYEAFGGSIPFFCKRPFQIRSTKQVIQ